VRNAAVIPVGLVILLAVAGATYQFIATRAEARRSPEAGRLVVVGGYQLKINCTGKGSSTVVLEAGLPFDSKARKFAAVKSDKRVVGLQTQQFVLPMASGQRV
jgi:hypothetical protein